MSSFRASASLEMLRRRAQLLDQLRAFFKQRGFLEVETPIVGHQVVVDRFIDPIQTTPLTGAKNGTGEQRDAAATGWLQTSPELSMKRLLACGATALFQVCKAFRAEEVGSLHNPEFTMVEWYRVGDDQAAAIKFLGDLYESLVPGTSVQTQSYQEAFAEITGLNPHTAKTSALEAYCRQQNIDAPTGLDRDGWLNLLLATQVEPTLGVENPTILYDYPASQAALAQTVDRGSHNVAERFELYANGIELANGYHELLDATVLQQRQAQENDKRIHDGKCRLPEPEYLVQAMREGLPACSGVALGFDRLVMLATGVDKIQDVLAFPFDRC